MYWFWIGENESDNYITMTDAQAAAGQIVENGGEYVDVIYDEDGNEYPVF